MFEIIRKVYDSKISCIKIAHPESYPNDEPQRRCPNLEKAFKDLNYIPEISLENGLKKFFEWAKLNYELNKWFSPNIIDFKNI